MMRIGEILCNVCFAAILGIAVWQDIHRKKIKNQVNLTGVLLGLFFALILPEKSIWQALTGFAILLGTGLICWNLHFFQAGDAKLFCVVGTFLGWKSGVSCLLTAIVIGGIAGIPFVLWRLIKKRKGEIKFPFSIAIAVAILIEVSFGHLWTIL